MELLGDCGERKDYQKKSNATRVQPEKPASRATRCPSGWNGISLDDELVLVCKVPYFFGRDQSARARDTITLESINSRFLVAGESFS